LRALASAWPQAYVPAPAAGDPVRRTPIEAMEAQDGKKPFSRAGSVIWWKADSEVLVELRGFQSER
jgi:hypothetical protein